jgi:hypothetical protein
MYVDSLRALNAERARPYNNFCAVMQIVLQTWLALGLSLLGAVFSASAFKDIRERSAIASYVTADEKIAWVS